MSLEERLFSGRQPVNGGREAGLSCCCWPDLTPEIDQSHPARRTEASCPAGPLSVV